MLRAAIEQSMELARLGGQEVAAEYWRKKQEVESIFTETAETRFNRVSAVSGLVQAGIRPRNGISVRTPGCVAG